MKVRNVEDINIKITDSDADPHEFSAQNRADKLISDRSVKQNPN